MALADELQQFQGFRLARLAPALLDTIVAVLLVFGLSYWLNPDDPLYINGPFPWPWFAVIYIGLRYGLAAGLLPLGALLGYHYWFAASWIGELNVRVYFLSGFLWLVMVTVVRDKWQHETKRWQEIGEYSEQQLTQLGKAYYTTRLSHDHLEEHLISQPFTIREAFETLQDAIQKAQGRLDRDTAYYFLEILSQTCSVKEALIYPLDESNQVLAHEPLVGFHCQDTLAVNDPLIAHVVAKRPDETITLRDTEQQSHYILCSPLKSSTGRYIGIVVVKAMDFWAINHENFKVIGMLSAYFADQIWSDTVAETLLPELPDCPQAFAHACFQFSYFYQHYALPSSLVLFKMDLEDQSDHVRHRLSRLFRATDFVWWFEKDGYVCCLVLLTFTSNIGLEGFLNRINQWFGEYFSHLIDGQKLNITTRQLTARPIVEQIQTLVQ